MEFKEKNYAQVISCAAPERAKRIQGVLFEKGLGAVVAEKKKKPPAREKSSSCLRPFPPEAFIPEISLAVFAEGDIVYRRRKKKAGKSRPEKKSKPIPI